LPDVKYVHISWSTLRTNLGHDFGFSGSDLCPEAARRRQISRSIFEKEVSRASTRPIPWQQGHGSLIMNVTLGRTLFLVISIKPSFDNSETPTVDRSFSTAFFISSKTSFLFAGAKCYIRPRMKRREREGEKENNNVEYKYNATRKTS
jgi:hypothetical protein